MLDGVAEVRGCQRKQKSGGRQRDDEGGEEWEGKAAADKAMARGGRGGRGEKGAGGREPQAGSEPQRSCTSIVPTQAALRYDGR